MTRIEAFDLKYYKHTLSRSWQVHVSPAMTKGTGVFGEQSFASVPSYPYLCRNRTSIKVFNYKPVVFY